MEHLTLRVQQWRSATFKLNQLCQGGGSCRVCEPLTQRMKSRFQTAVSSLQLPPPSLVPTCWENVFNCECQAVVRYFASLVVLFLRESSRPVPTGSDRCVCVWCSWTVVCCICVHFLFKCAKAHVQIDGYSIWWHDASEVCGQSSSFCISVFVICGWTPYLSLQPAALSVRAGWNHRRAWLRY